MTDKVELLTVEYVLALPRYTALYPDFAVPFGVTGRWKDRSETAVLQTPDGQQCSVNVEFSLTHHQVVDPKDIDRSWRITALLMDFGGKSPPLGSKLFVSRESRDALFADQVS